MQVAVFSTTSYDRRFLDPANTRYGHQLDYFEARLVAETALLARGYPAVCAFVNDQVDRAVIEILSDGGTRLIALRAAGFNNVDLVAADEHDMRIMRVPAYSPHSVAEHTVALMLALNRRLPRAVARIRDGNFALDGLLGFDLSGRTVGIVGTGAIGAVVARIMTGFGCTVLAVDVRPNESCLALGVRYVDQSELFASSDIITLHCPLVPETYHLINAETLAQTRPGVMIINTGRGALLDTPAVIDALKAGRIGYLGLDVYEEEEALFFRDLSNVVIQDDVFARLLTFPNVIITGHQAFFTHEALTAIAETTMANIRAFEHSEPSPNDVSVERVVRSR